MKTNAGNWTLAALFLALPALAWAQEYTITTVAGGGACCHPGDGGQATSAYLQDAYGVALDSAGNFYISDRYGDAIRKVAPAGVISTVAGDDTDGFTGDGGPAVDAQLGAPEAIVVDAAGNLYIADSLNNRVRKVSTNGIITTIAGTGGFGFNGDGGPATSATLNGPDSLAIDGAGNLYIGEGGDIRKIAPSGIISTVAGCFCGSYASGLPATMASVSTPFGLTVDNAGNLYFTDAAASPSPLVRKISPNGIVTTVAGGGPCCVRGDGGAAINAYMPFPFGVAVDSSGNIFISDMDDNVVRMVSPNGIITTVAGGGACLQPAPAGLECALGDGGPATGAILKIPRLMASTGAGAIYVTDGGDNRVRLLTPAATTLTQPPSIRSTSGVISAGAYGGFSAIAPGSWIEIYGANLSSASRLWNTADFSGNTAPTELNGTSVTIAGQSAFVDYISPGQVNVQVPSGVAVGSQQLIVKTSAGSGSPYPVTVKAEEPGLLAPSAFDNEGLPYVAALFPDGATWVLPPNTIPGLPSRSAEPGDTLTLYGIGFGAVIPGVSAGQIEQQTNSLALPLTFSFGGANAQATFAGMVSGSVGLYQFDVVVPPGSPSGPVQLTFTLNGVEGTQTLYISIL